MASLAGFHKQYVIILTFASVCIFVALVMMSRWSSWKNVNLNDQKATPARPMYAYNSTMEKADHVPTEIALAAMQDENSFTSKPAKNSFLQNQVKNPFTLKLVQNNSIYTGLPAKPDKKLAVLSITKMKTPMFLKDFKNPCWSTENKDGIVRCIPYFYIAGISKCGTSDLHYRVVAHPLIVPGKVKEPQYFSRVFYKRFKSMRYKEKCDVHCGTELYSITFYRNAARAINFSNSSETFDYQLNKRSNWLNKLNYKFLAWFPKESKALLEKSQEQFRYPMITGDSSPSTAWDNKYWQQIEENEGLLEPRFITADWIRKINPKARIVMILRDPVTRSFSQYVFSRRRREIATIEEYHRGIIDAIKRQNACFESGTPPLMCTMENPRGFRLGASIYHLHVKNWLDRFPRSQVLVLRFEDYIRNSTRILEQVYSFLELPPLSHDAMRFITSSEVINKTKKKHDIGPVKPEINEMLANFFKPHNEKLAQLLGDERFLWND